VWRERRVGAETYFDLQVVYGQSHFAAGVAIVVGNDYGLWYKAKAVAAAAAAADTDCHW